MYSVTRVSILIGLVHAIEPVYAESGANPKEPSPRELTMSVTSPEPEPPILALSSEPKLVAHQSSEPVPSCGTVAVVPSTVSYPAGGVTPMYIF